MSWWDTGGKHVTVTGEVRYISSAGAGNTIITLYENGYTEWNYEHDAKHGPQPRVGHEVTVTGKHEYNHFYQVEAVTIEEEVFDDQ